jgi:hypothetical protein
MRNWKKPRRRTMNMRNSLTFAGLLLIFATNAQASQILFRGQNAGLFPDANPGAMGILMNSVDRPENPQLASALGGISPSTLVMQSVQSQISAEIKDQIFNGGAASGTFDLGGGSIISFIRAGGNVNITFIDPVHGTTTISIPDI